MLDEWIRYVDDAGSRIIVPPDLGPKWGEVLKAARIYGLEQATADFQDVARCWVGYLRKAALRLRAKLGVDVQVRLSRKERDDVILRAQNCANAQEGTLIGSLRIPDAAGDIGIKVILPSRSVQYSLQVSAPTEGRQATRVNWLSRQLRAGSLPAGDLVVKADWSVRGLSTSTQLRDFLEDTSKLHADRAGVTVPRDANPRYFRIEWTTALPKGRGRSSAPVLQGISAGLEEFYHGVVQDIQPFVPKAPRLETNGPTPEDAGDEGHAAESQPHTAAEPTGQSGDQSQPDANRADPTTSMKDDQGLTSHSYSLPGPSPGAPGKC